MYLLYCCLITTTYYVSRYKKKSPSEILPIPERTNAFALAALARETERGTYAERERRYARENMNEALNIQTSSSSSSLPLSSHIHLVSCSNAPTAFLFAHVLHECVKNNNGGIKNNANTNKIVCVETSMPFKTLICPYLKKVIRGNVTEFYRENGIESVDCWSRPVDFFSDDENGSEKEDENAFTVKSSNMSSISSLDGLYDLIEKKIVSGEASDVRKADATSCSIFIDSLDVLAARTSEKAVLRLLVRLREIENVALVTGCARAAPENTEDQGVEAEVEDLLVDEDDRERRTMQLLVENLADVTLTTSKLPSEGGNKGELVKVVTRHRTVDSKYLDWDGSVVDGSTSTLVDEGNGNGRLGVGKLLHAAGERDNEDDELTSSMFSLTTECVATISELGAKCERYSFSV